MKASRKSSNNSLVDEYTDLVSELAYYTAFGSTSEIPTHDEYLQCAELEDKLKASILRRMTKKYD